MSRRYLAPPCPVDPSHGPLVDWPTDRWAFYCPHQDHDGRMPGHPMGEAPATLAFFRTEEVSPGSSPPKRAPRSGHGSLATTNEASDGAEGSEAVLERHTTAVLCGDRMRPITEAIAIGYLSPAEVLAAISQVPTSMSAASGGFAPSSPRSRTPEPLSSPPERPDRPSLGL